MCVYKKRRTQMVDNNAVRKEKKGETNEDNLCFTLLTIVYNIIYKCTRLNSAPEFQFN